MPHYPDTPEGRATNAAYCREWRRKNVRWIRAYKRKYNKEWRKKNGYHNEKNSAARYPEKERARNAVYRAIRAGRLKKLPCSVCNNFNSEAHHPDHSKQLEVIWLCRRHHQVAHGRSMDL